MDVEYKVIQASQFMEANLHENISADDIAMEVAVSKRQLYRFFQQVVKDSPLHYLRVRRLTEASKHISSSNDSIIDVAFNYCFNSAENFCRAFSQQFWHSPRKFRCVGSAFHVTQREALTGVEFSILNKGFSQLPEVVTFKPKTFVGSTITLPNYGFLKRTNLEREAFANYLPEIENLVNDDEWNMVYRHLGSVQLHELENFTGVEVSKVGRYPDELRTFQVPASKYLVFKHEGPEYLLNFSISKALSWLVNSHFYLGDGPTLFHVKDANVFKGDLYIPISDVLQPYLKWWSGYGRGLTWRIGGERN